MCSSSDFPKAAAVLRGCGERTPGGVYIECSLSPVGRPFEDFLIDPPLALPAGFGKETLANKPQLWTDPESDAVHLVLWIGEQHYPYLADFVEEAKRAGISRKISPHLLERPDFGRISLASRMILAHPRALGTRWLDQEPSLHCAKGVSGHALPSEPNAGADDDGERLLPGDQVEPTGPCLFKTWQLIPTQAAQALTDPLMGAPIMDPVTLEIQRKRFVLGGRRRASDLQTPQQWTGARSGALQTAAADHAGLQAAHVRGHAGARPLPDAERAQRFLHPDC